VAVPVGFSEFFDLTSLGRRPGVGSTFYVSPFICEGSNSTIMISQENGSFFLAWLSHRPLITTAARRPVADDGKLRIIWRWGSYLTIARFQGGRAGGGRMGSRGRPGPMWAAKGQPHVEGWVSVNNGPISGNFGRGVWRALPLANPPQGRKPRKGRKNSPGTQNPRASNLRGY